MKINRIQLKNIGSYEELNEFDIKSQDQGGHIVVIGGKNGAGKTTLFTSIKLCLYGHKESGYQAINNYYKKNIKRLINDKAKLQNNADAFVLLDIEILNGQEWDNYVLKRSWNLNGDDFETFTVTKNGVELSTDEILDFDNFLLNLIPPELFELYFFDGEQIADFFLDESNSERIKHAFLTLCGYDTFEIIYKNFKKLSKNSSSNNDSLNIYFKAEDDLYLAEKNLKQNKVKIDEILDIIENENTKLAAMENTYSNQGGVSIEEWNDKFLQLKQEERIREEKNLLVKNAVNDSVPYVILKNEIQELLKLMDSEKENERIRVLKESVVSILPGVLSNVQKSRKSFSDKMKNEILEAVVSELGNEQDTEGVLNLSKDEYKRLFDIIIQLLAIDKNEIINNRTEIKKSIIKSQEIRDEIENVNIEGIQEYLKNKEETLKRIQNLFNEKEKLIIEQKELEEEVNKCSLMYKRAEKDLDKQLKNESVSSLTAKSIPFLDALQKRLFASEIDKVERLFMRKMNQLMRKDQFIDKIVIDDEFKLHVYKKVNLSCSGLCKTIRNKTIDVYMKEYGQVHCSDILNVSGCDTLDEFVNKYGSDKEEIEVLVEFDKSIMSNGEKQVFIMALYWAMIQLSNKQIPFIIDTPFARIDTIHRAHITEKFFKSLDGQVFIFSTDEEINEKHMDVIGDDLSAKFLIENTDNIKTEIKSGVYFGDTI